jgi:hypothetical protein
VTLTRLAPLALALAALVWATGWSPPLQQPITVVGQVTNGTPAGTTPTDLPVALHVFSGMDRAGAYTTTLSADGSFRFDDVTLEAGAALATRVEYQDVVYFSDLLTLEGQETEVELPVTVFETTEDPSTVLVTQLHMFFLVAGERLQISEYYLIGNTGDRTYAGVADPETGERATLEFTLPAGAEGLTFDGPGLGERFLEQDGRFADTNPVPPGSATSEVFFTYELPYRGGMSVERSFEVPVSSVVMLLRQAGVTLQGDGVIAEGTIDTQMGAALSYTAGPLMAGQPLVIQLTEEPQAGPEPVPMGGAAPTRNAGQEIALGVLALAVASVVIYLMWRGSSAGPLPAHARSLVTSIAALDADFEAGKVSERVYRSKRDSLKRQLRRRLRSTSGPEAGPPEQAAGS